ncbi:MAG: CBS domain-containing protein [Deltaproteobacteria bacterium]|nr:CBS domain-containing protein [Deltaproteobacteria bacterium]
MNRRHKKMPVVGAVMTSFPHFVDADDTVAKVERLMDERAIRHLPVQERGRVAPVEEKNNVRARDIMVADPYVVSFNTPLNEVVSEMAQRHIGSAIVTRSGKLAGVLSANDVCRILGEYLESRFGADGGDDAA